MLAEAVGTASNGADWAVVAAFAAAAAAIGSVFVTLRVSHNRLVQEGKESEKRLAHEERMLEKRLAHERDEAIRLRAAEAFSKATQVCALLNPNRVNHLAEDSQLLMQAGRFLDELVDELGVVMAVGSERVRATAALVADYAERLERAARGAVVDQSSNSSNLKTSGMKWDDVFLKAVTAVEDYRQAVAGEDRS